jgi:hypothetical protein
MMLNKRVLKKTKNEKHEKFQKQDLMCRKKKKKERIWVDLWVPLCALVNKLNIFSSFLIMLLLGVHNDIYKSSYDMS